MSKVNNKKPLTPDELTPLINQQNVESVRRMIQLKKESRPYYANADTVTNVITDQDHFPYTRYFRGVYYYPDPIVAEREAGWREVRNSCYDLHGCSSLPTPYPKHCYQGSCSLVVPCYTQFFSTYADKNALDIHLNKACI